MAHSIEQLLERWLSEQSLAAGTLKFYRQVNRLFIVWLVKNADNPVNATRKDFVRWHQELREAGRSPRTIDSYTAAVRQFYSYLVESNIRDDNPTDKTKNVRRSSDYVRAPLTVEELTRLIKSTSGPSLIEKRNTAIILLASFLGLRRIEIIRLNVGDFINREGQTFVRIHGKGHAEPDALLPVLDNVLSAIKDYWILQTDRPVGSSPAFLSHACRGSVRLQPSFVSKLVKRQLRAIGIDDTMHSCHSLRHTAAFMAYRGGSSVHDIQALLRQRNPGTTQIYLQSFRRIEAESTTAISTLYQYYAREKEKREKQGINQ